MFKAKLVIIESTSISLYRLDIRLRTVGFILLLGFLISRSFMSCSSSISRSFMSFNLIYRSFMSFSLTSRSFMTFSLISKSFMSLSLTSMSFMSFSLIFSCLIYYTELNRKSITRRTATLYIINLKIFLWITITE